MKKSCLTLLVLTFLLAAVGSMPAQEQDSERACVIVSEGQNQNRTVAGRINVECDPVTYGLPPYFNFHDPPFGVA